MILALCSAIIMCGWAGAETFYVSTSGSDGNDGTSPSTPFRTLSKAQSSVRASAKTSATVVNIMGGVYGHESGIPMVFSEEDSGQSGAEVVWQAYEGEDVLLTGGMSVDLTECKVPSGASGLCASLDPFSPLSFDVLSGSLKDCQHWRSEFFYNGEAMILARYPNVNATTGLATWAYAEKGVGSDAFVASTTRPLSWTHEAQPILHVYPQYDWADEFGMMANATAGPSSGTSVVTISPAFAFKTYARWMGMNLLAELDAPGEYYISQANNTLYFLPPTSSVPSSSIRGGWHGPPAWGLRERGNVEAFVSVLPSVMNFSSTSYFQLRNVRVEHAVGTGIVATDVDNFLISNVTSANHGNDGIILNGTNSKIEGGEVYGTACRGVFAYGGDYLAQTPGNITVDGTQIHHYSRYKRTYQGGIYAGGVDNVFTNLAVGSAPHQAFLVSGNELPATGLEFSNFYIYDVAYEVSDSGAFYSCGQPSQHIAGTAWVCPGSVIRDGRIEHVRALIPIHNGSPHQSGLYLDDQMSFWTVSNVSFRDANQGILLGGGRNTTVSGCTFAQVDNGVAPDARGLNWQKESCTPPSGDLWEGLENVNYKSPPWSTKYPFLQDIASNHPCYPFGTKITDNLYCSSSTGQFSTISDSQATAWYMEQSNNNPSTQPC